MTVFTPGFALAGGLLIGLSVALGFALYGRVLGVSGLFASLPSLNPFPALFALGLIGGPVLVGDVHGFSPPPWAAIVVGGLLVGFGTRMGSGCTSGHGVAGLARLSPRSIVATLTFMAAGIITMFLVRGVLQWV